MRKVTMFFAILTVISVSSVGFGQALYLNPIPLESNVFNARIQDEAVVMSFQLSHDYPDPVEVGKVIVESNVGNLKIRFTIDGWNIYYPTFDSKFGNADSLVFHPAYKLAPGEVVICRVVINLKNVYSDTPVNIRLSVPLTYQYQQYVLLINQIPTIRYYLNGSYNGWYLISFPISPPSDNIYDLIPGLKQVFYWDPWSGEYCELQERNLRYYSNEKGLSFFVKISSDCEFDITGTPIFARNVQVNHGWNLLGSTFQGSYVNSTNHIVTASYKWNPYDWYTSAYGFVNPQKGIWIYCAETGYVQVGQGPPGTVGKTAGGSEPPPPPWEMEVTDVEKGDLVLPSEFSLEQNYPNPFNPTTTISFSLPKQSEVNLVVYNLNGQIVKNLVTGQLNTGQHQILWNSTDNSGQSVPSGVYFYQISANNFRQIRRMTLMK